MKYVDIPGSGRIRLATSADVTRAISAQTPVAPRPALIASARRGSRRQDRAERNVARLWQETALTMYDSIGEFRFAAQFYGKFLSRVRFYPARLNDDGTTTPIDGGPPVDILNQIRDPGGGRSRLQYDYGRLMFVTGEGVLFGSRLEQDDARWQFLWREEVEFTGNEGQAERKDATGKKTGETGQGYRFWTPHPRHSDEPDSPFRSVLDIGLELLLLTAAVGATARTRLTNGLLLIPSELSPNTLTDVGRDEDPENNILLERLIEHVSNQIENPEAAEARVPPILEAAYDYLDGVRHLQLHDPQTDYMERELRKEAIGRAALGMDFPPEFLLGMTDANHWTAKQVQHEMWRSHGAPMAEQFADDLAQAFLQPTLREENFPEPESVVIAYDDSKVVTSPDMTQVANDGLKMAAIGRPAWRKLSGVDEDMAPDDDEQEFLLSLITRQPVEVEDGKIVMGERGPVGDPMQNGNGNAAEGPPEPSNGRTGSRQEARTASILGAAALALRQCRAKAGARLRSHQHACPECLEKTKDIPHSLVAAILGEQQVHELADPSVLVKGGTEEFRGYLTELGIEHVQANALCARLEVYAANTLFEERQPELPPGFMAQVAQAEEVSDALAY